MGVCAWTGLATLWGQFDGRGGRKRGKAESAGSSCEAPLIPLLLIIPPTHFISFNPTQIHPGIIPDRSADILSFIYHTLPLLSPTALRADAASPWVIRDALRRSPPDVCIRRRGRVCRERMFCASARQVGTHLKAKKCCESSGVESTQQWAFQCTML